MTAFFILFEIIKKSKTITIRMAKIITGTTLKTWEALMVPIFLIIIETVVGSDR
ncbi:MAG: hypothetical protein UT48_C0005G0028 [Parcubacteria group bacterium GW2011_GWE2_39_37]|nr:MAG: hypothetical protein UT48_C0005G0028 [Parcubacteria group bacterium GW2011_GWE2_39_37]